MPIKKPITTPHGPYFRIAMSDIRVAREFLKHSLLQPILELVDLRLSIADMLFLVKFKDKPGYLTSLNKG